MANYIYEKSTVAIDKLENEIKESEITIALDYINFLSPNSLTVYFKAALSSGEEDILDNIVSNHDGILLNYPTLVTLDELKDDDNVQIVQPKTTKLGWRFQPRMMSFITSKYKSEYSKKENGENVGDLTLKFYNSGNEELVKGEQESDQDFQTRLTNNCVKTYADWHAQYTQDLIGAILICKTIPENSTYAWAVIAPDLPAEYGGNAAYLEGGFDLSFLHQTREFWFNGRGAKTLKIDNSPYKTNKIRFIIKHDVGVQIPLQLLIEHFIQ